MAVGLQGFDMFSLKHYICEICQNSLLRQSKQNGKELLVWTFVCLTNGLLLKTHA